MAVPLTVVPAISFSSVSNSFTVMVSPAMMWLKQVAPTFPTPSTSSVADDAPITT